MTVESKNVYFDVLDDITDEYNSTYKTIKIKATAVESDSYAGYSFDCNGKDAKFKIGGHVRISK